MLLYCVVSVYVGMFRLCISYRKHHGKVPGVPRFVMYVYVPVITMYTVYTFRGYLLQSLAIRISASVNKCTMLYALLPVVKLPIFILCVCNR